MATLRYIACISENPENLTEFYRRFLGTDEIGRSPEGDISITDGFYNLTLFKKRRPLVKCGWSRDSTISAWRWTIWKRLKGGISQSILAA